mgnify:CR=1 FL=1
MSANSRTMVSAVERHRTTATTPRINHLSFGSAQICQPRDKNTPSVRIVLAVCEVFNGG